MVDKVDQSHQGKKAKVLSLGEQKKAVRGVKKFKASKVIKSSLESPFALEWPNISVQEEEEVCQLFLQSCKGLQLKIEPAIPWYKIRHLPPLERNALRSERQSSKVHGQLEWKNDIVMGYNSVMKAIERDEIAGLLVKKDVEPCFLIKAFLPGCATKGIPLLPTVALKKMVGGLGVKYSTLVIGFRNSVTNSDSRFHPVYLKLCEILEVEQDEEEEEGSQVVEKEEKECEAVKTRRLSEAEIAKYNLKRNKQGERVFIPPGDAAENNENRTNPDVTGSESDFISLGSGLMEREEYKPPSVEIEKTIKENVAQKSYLTGKSSAFFKDFIFLDAEGEHTDIPEAVTGVMEADGDVSTVPERLTIPKDTITTETCDPSEPESMGRGQDLKAAGNSIPSKSKKPRPEYKPANIKKTVNDPNRKKRIGKI